ncbi:MAG: c-type cytochrome [Thermoanaerobaculia bacterium]
MKRNVAIVVLLSFVALVAVFSMARASDTPAGTPDPKAIFLAQKCNLCHSLAAASIERTMKSSKAPDLSGVGLERDAAWIGKFITKQEKLNGKPHQKMFSGSEAELKALTQWLAGMKQKP